MINGLRKFGGAIMLYAVIFFGIVGIVASVNWTQRNDNSISKSVIAVNK